MARRSVTGQTFTGLLQSDKRGVEYCRPELIALEPSYSLIRDVLAGSRVIKAKRDLYLPIPNANDDSDDNMARYESYLCRAVFYNVTKRTLNGLIGEIFVRDPIVEVPAALDNTVLDVTGSGINIEQFAKKNVGYVLAYGRSGILADYPATEAQVTQAQLLAGEIRPTIKVYQPWEIINWRTFVRGAKTLLNLVVIFETEYLDDDGFELATRNCYRVLRLMNDVYTVQIWTKSEDDKSVWVYDEYTPRDANGNVFDEIPFTFIGSENNDPSPDQPPLFDLADLNLAHYRNSADYEESLFICGQPTPVLTGLTEEWVKTVLKNKVPLGARAAIPLPVGASAELLQVQPNTMPFEGMQHKERQMVALGAKLVEQATVQRTATETQQENASESSTLATSAKNVANAIKWALEWCAVFVVQGGKEGQKAGIDFQLNTDFKIATMTAADRDQAIKEWQSDAITFGEMRTVLHKAGIATLPDDEAKVEIETQAETAFNTDLAQQSAMADALGSDTQPGGNG